MAVRALTWKKTRSTTTASGRNSATRARSSSDSVRRRSGRGMVGGDEITPPATAASDAVAPGHHAVAAAGQAGIDPEDEHAFDGSRRGRPCGVDPAGRRAGSAVVGGHDLVGDVEVGVDVLHVVVVVERLEQAQDPLGLGLVGDLDGRRRAPWSARPHPGSSPASSSAARTAIRSAGSLVTTHRSPSSARSSPPASMATSSTRSSSWVRGTAIDALALELPADRARLGHGRRRSWRRGCGSRRRCGCGCRSGTRRSRPRRPGRSPRRRSDS